jgi:23S rRNA (uracil1939-C5)-methyltransferase
MKVKIEKLDNLGRGITHINNKICFIENALPNEIVEITINKETNKYIEASTKKNLETSPLRITEECLYSNRCGGCQLNHLGYNEENKFKKNKVSSLIKKYGNIDNIVIEPIIYKERNKYRNKIIIHGKDKKLGLYEKKSNDIIPIQECLLVNNKINDLIKIITKNNQEIEEVIIKTSNDEKEAMVSIKGNITNKKELLDNCDVLIINNEYQTEKQSIITSIGKRIYQESISSFFQVNSAVTELLYDEILNNVKDKKYKTALDLYCGTGTIAIYISECIDKIIGIDNNQSNIEDAKTNKKLNKIENIEFICDKVENKIDTYKDIDLIIVDPPRAGLDQKTRDYLKKISPKKIIYVSCEPITLARDLKDLKETYEVKSIKPFNMFPRTYHVETVSVLCRKTIEK